MRFVACLHFEPWDALLLCSGYILATTCEPFYASAYSSDFQDLSMAFATEVVKQHCLSDVRGLSHCWSLLAAQDHKRRRRIETCHLGQQPRKLQESKKFRKGST